MADWRNKMNIADVIQAYEHGDISPESMGELVAERMAKKRERLNFGVADSKLKEKILEDFDGIICQFESIECIEDFDAVLAQFYDLGDTILNNAVFNGQKFMWIETSG